MFTPYQSKRAFEEIAGQIKRAILTNKLNEGDRLPSERDLSQQFRAGRMTVREALRTLESAGFIKIKTGSEGGAFIAFPDPDVLSGMIMDKLEMEGITEDQITETRIVLESAIVESAIQHMTPEDVLRIEQNVEETKFVKDLTATDEIFNKLIQFHVLLAEASHNRPFVMFIRTLAQWSRRHPGKIPITPKGYAQLHRSHQGVFEAIKGKNVKLAKRRIQEDIEETKRLRGDWIR